MPQPRRQRLPPTPVVRAAMRTRAGLTRLRDRMVPPEAVLIERSMGTITTRLLGVVAELGVADLLDRGSATAGEISGQIGTAEDPTERMLRYLASQGLLTRSRRGRYSNNRYTRLLRTDADDSLRDWTRYMGSPWMGKMILAADEVAATGISGAEAATGHSFFDYLTKVDPDAKAVFNSAMTDLGKMIGPLVPSAFDFSGAPVICDVGGGVGTALANILRANPGARGVLYDLPEVIEEAGEPFAELAVDDRVELVGGDFFESVPKGCDLYYLQAILHDWGDEDALRVLSAVTEAMELGARIVVTDAILEPGAPDDLRFGIDMIMLLGTGNGRERTEPEWQALFGRAGLKERSRSTLPTMSTIFELTPR